MNARRQLRRAVDQLLAGAGSAQTAYDDLLSKCLRLGDAEQARKLESNVHLHSIGSASTFLHNRLLHVFGWCRRISDARRLFDEMPRRDAISYNSMLSALTKAGSLDEARSLFACIACPGSVSYNTLISSLVKHGCAAEGLRCLVEMGMVGHGPTEYTAVPILNACAQLMDLRRGMEVHGWVAVRRLSSNLFIWNPLIDMYGKCGFVHGERKLFIMPCRNVVSWNSMIVGYVWNGDYESCLSLFSAMRASGFEPDRVTCSSVLSAYLKLGLLAEARSVFDEVKQKDEVVWASFIAGHAQNGIEEEA